MLRVTLSFMQILLNSLMLNRQNLKVLSIIFCFCCLSLSGAQLAEGIELRVKGPPSVLIQLKSGRTADGQTNILINSMPLTLWCQAVDARSLQVISAEEIFFRHNGQKFLAKFVDDTKQNATFTRAKVSVDDSGIWTCHVRTRNYGNATGDIFVYLRPVINTALRVDERSSSNFHFDLSGITVVRGEDAQLECPAFSYPKPTIVWEKNGGKLDPKRSHISKNGVLTIEKATYKDGGTYVCIAKNSYSHKGQNYNFDVKIDRNLRVKSEYAWIPPFIIIILIIALLFATIVFCEFRKRRNEQKLLEAYDE